MTPKKYDRQYFDRWYRGRYRIGAEPDVQRKVSLAIGVSEYFLRRAVRNAIDIGCGEAPWLAHLVTLRPRIRYVGYDPSDYAVEQFGAARNVRRGSFGELRELQIREKFDLVICADVLHYLTDEEIAAGLPVMVRLMRGAAFLEILTREEDVIGDMAGLIRRPAQWYRETFTRAGLRQVGPFMWVTRTLHENAAALEKGE